MTIWKHEQTDGSHNWFLYQLARIFSIQCKSHIVEWKIRPLRCSLWRWHPGKHQDYDAGTKWCYGDEFFE